MIQYSVWVTVSNVIQVGSGTGNPSLLQRDNGTVYLAYRKGDNYVYVLTNSGGGWSSPVQTTAAAQGDPALIETDSDIVLIYKGTDGHCYRVSSTDGVTWSSPSQIAPNKIISDPATVTRKDRFYRVIAQYVSASATDLVKVLEFSYEGEYYLPDSCDVIVRDDQTLQSSMHFEFDSKGRIVERISKDEQGVQTEKIVYTYNNNYRVIRQDVYSGASTGISYSVIKGYDNKGNVVYTKDPEGAEHFYSYANTNCTNQFVDSKGEPVNLFTNAFYTNSIPSNCRTLTVGEAFINSGKVTETYYEYDASGNLTETKTLFPTRDYIVFSGTFDENTQTTFEFDLTGLTITDGILVISSIAVPTQETLQETHSEVGNGWLNSGSWSGKYFLADYLRCQPGEPPDCFDGETKIGPFEHYPGSPGYTGYTTWVEDNRTQYVETSYSVVVNEYPGQTEYKLNNGSWTIITSDLGSGATSTVIPASSFVQGLNTLQFQESNAYSTKFEWILYIDQGSTPEEFITGYQHDIYGNLTTATNAEGHTITYEYAAEYQNAYLTAKIDVVDGQTISVFGTYNFGTGYVTSRTCACGSVTYYEHDLLGRLTKVIYPLGLGEQVPAEYEIVYDDIDGTISLYNENDEKIVKYYDGIGRMTKVETYNDTLWAASFFEYNYLGKIERAIDPLSRVYQYEYDSIGRVTKFVNPDQTFRTMEYDDITNTITLKDENQHKKVYTFNWTGNLLSAKEYEGTNYYLTEYQYDRAGNLTKMIDPEQNITTYVYDSIFGITAALYPDLTEQHFSYDAIGNVIERIDQNGNHITYTYDAVSRLKHIDYGDTYVSVTYDPSGNRTSMITPDNTMYYSYDARNRLIQVISTIDGKSYSVGYTYDSAGNVTEMMYPDGTTIQYSYFLEDQVECIQDYASFAYFPDGNLREVLLPNGVMTGFGYDSRGRLQNIHAYSNDDLLDLTYSYDPVGNIMQVENSYLTATSEWVTSTELYGYDDLNRLISASNGFGTLSYTYDSKKRSSITENGQSTSYVYDHDLLVAAGQQVFTYDSNGNMLSKSSQSVWTYHYNKVNRLTQMERDGQLFGKYEYDGDGKRTRKTEWSEDSQEYLTTIYVYSGLDVVYEESMAGTALYIYGPSGRIAKRTIINGETNTFYYTNDHLGSTRMITDENSTPMTSLRYYPFGKSYEYSGSPESYLFTGKERDLTGLYYLGARYYDPETGRFLTRDPYTFLPDDPRVSTLAEERTRWLMKPQRFDRFSYAGNNPLRYKDPIGLSFVCLDPECQDLLDEGDEDPPPEDTPPENPSPDDDDGYDSRQEECEECDCKDRTDIKTLRWLKRKVYLGELGVAAAYGILCGIAGAMVCWETGPGAAVCGVVGGLACSLYFGVIVHASNEDVINDIHWAMANLGCTCAIYC